MRLTRQYYCEITLPKTGLQLATMGQETYSGDTINQYNYDIEQALQMCASF